MAGGLSGGLAAGLESGLRLGMGLRQQEQSEQDRTLDRDLKAQDLELRRAQVQDSALARASARRASVQRLVNDQEKGLLGELSATIRQYGGMDKVPESVGRPLVERRQRLAELKDGLLAEEHGTRLTDMIRNATDTFSRLQDGRVSVQGLGGRDLANAFQVAARRPLSDLLMGPKGEPSRVQQGYQDFTTGLKTDNPGLMIRGANVLLAPELRRGIGAVTPDGGEIVSKELHSVIPDPRQQGDVLPVLAVTVGYPDGSTKSGLAPVTDARGTDPNEGITGLNMERALDYAHRLNALSSAINQPEVRAKAEKGLKEGAAEDFSNVLERAFYSLGGDPENLKKKAQWHNTDLGSEVLRELTDENGTVISSKREAKTQPTPAATLDRAARRKEIEASDLPPAEKRRAIVRLLSGADIEKPTAVPRGDVDARIERIREGVRNGTLTAEEGRRAEKRALTGLDIDKPAAPLTPTQERENRSILEARGRLDEEVAKRMAKKPKMTREQVMDQIRAEAEMMPNAGVSGTYKQAMKSFVGVEDAGYTARTGIKTETTRASEAPQRAAAGGPGGGAGTPSPTAGGGPGVTPAPAARLRAPPTQADLESTAKKYGITVDQVKQRLGM